MNEREARSNPHPPACTCANCTERRLRRRKGGVLSRLLAVFKRKR